ncbi:iron-siderophore ABC transporter substrate-binding protein [Nodularia sp. UHCC 0506]|uniref:ABC transporter substrate-binding protein n=1 Tax=Nodularia sp. UHCC 0506 TaxID=3110243 RepID=UPI002B206295|nr:iron-siderophore ABC transporter substrate-binding protein [Nodularia sp. UHCC 0506]MEA5516458.1 iron-siderophore ABC transporter substrate-binding protein [Nodularia sp. UHCC 0506]
MLQRFSLSLFLLGLLTLVSCQSNETVSRPIPDPANLITHTRGETAVPINPERVVALDNIALDSVLTLGVQPIAALIDQSTGKFPVHLRDQITDRTEKLSSNQPNLERITQLKPDLIIGGKNVEPVYNQLNQIAPTILLEQGGSSDWKSGFLLTAEAMGKLKQGETLLDNYHQRVEQLRSRLTNPEDMEVSVVRIFPQGLRLYQNDTFIGGILKDIGLSRPASQNENNSWVQISREKLEAADGDVIFVWSLGDEAQNKLAQLKKDPLWSKLNAVQAGKVYEVPAYWIGSGSIAANKVLNDLATYLLDKED